MGVVILAFFFYNRYSEVKEMKIGIVGNGGIVSSALSSLKRNNISYTALWCRNEQKGKPLCEEFGIGRLYTDYETFLKDDSFDTVYIGLINSLHYQYAKQALAAGKHVICEKPLTGTLKEAEELIQTAQEKNVFLFEAIMQRYSLNYEKVRESLPLIGEIRMVNANYSQYSRRYDDYQKGIVLPAFDPKLYGGALYDINVYNIHTMTGLFGRPKESVYFANQGFNGVDTSGVLVMDYGTFKAVCIGAKDSASDCFTMIQGTKGYIRIPGRPGIVKNAELVLYRGETINLDVSDDADPMGTEFRRIAEVLDQKDEETARKWMEASLYTMEVVQKSHDSISL